jgi:polyferredoxin
MSKVRKIPHHYWRRFSQILFGLLLLFLFRKTDYSGADQIPYAVNLFFRWDPLVAAATMLAAKTFIYLLLPALAVVLLTLLLGRFFCGWVCLLGAALDLAHHVITPLRSSLSLSFRKIKYALLLIILLTAGLGFPIAGYFDPFSILVRGMAVSVDPAFYEIVNYPFDLAFRHAPAFAATISEPVYSFLKSTIMPYNQKIFAYSILSLAVLVFVIGLEKLERRFWCRNLCPLGALLAVFSKWSLLRGHAGEKCGSCKVCRSICRMGAIDEELRISPEACIVCLDCVDACPSSRIFFNWRRPQRLSKPENISRRVFLGTIASGVVLPVLFKSGIERGKVYPFLLRPPGALAEKEFLARCVRCGECMKVCIGNALHPAFLEAGADGIFSPRLIPRLGYCEYNCTLCGQVCPTGAIRNLSKPEKQKVVIGRAYFDKNRCLPFARATSCIVCEEHCPTPDKAIKFKETALVNDRGEMVIMKQPYVIDELCIGCGICETKCPLPGRSAIIVTCEGESRNLDSEF